MSKKYPSPSAYELTRRFERLKTKRSNWETVWQELAEYLFPNKATVVIQRTPGSKTMQNVFDSTGIHAPEMLASNLHGSLTSSALQWFGMKMRSDELNEDSDITEFLEDCSMRMSRAFSQSFFYSEIQECYHDLVVFGTGALFEDKLPDLPGPRFGGFTFRCFPPASYCIEEDARGQVNEFDYEMMMSARSIVSMAPKWDVHGAVLKIAEKEPERDMPVLHMIYPRDGAKSKIGTEGGDLAIASCIIDLTNKHAMWEGGFHEFPAHVPRFRKASGEIYGRGPGHTALADVRTLNRATELGLQEWAKVINPPLEVLDEACVTEVRLTPAALNVVSQMGSIKPIVSGAKFDVHHLNVERLEERIRNMFFADQLVVRDGPQKTAEEVRIRYTLMQRILGPTIGRIETELLNSLIERSFGLMYRARAFKPEPRTLVEAKKRMGGEIDIVYEGPMSKGQRSGQAESIQEFIAFCGSVAAVWPAAPKMVKMYEALAEVADIKGVPKKVLASEDDMAQEEEAIKAAQADMASAKAGVDKSNVVKNLAQAGGVPEPPGGSVSAGPVPMSPIGGGGIGG